MPFDQQEFYVASPRSEPHVSDDLMLVALQKARALLADEKNWCKGDFRRGHRLCIAGASQKALGLSPGTDDFQSMRAERDSLREIINSNLPRGHFQMSLFNDAPSTTHADVLSLFDRAIAARTAELTRLD